MELLQWECLAGLKGWGWDSHVANGCRCQLAFPGGGGASGGHSVRGCTDPSAQGGQALLRERVTPTTTPLSPTLPEAGFSTSSCWHLGPGHSLLWSAVLRIVRCVPASLASAQ